MKAMPVGFSVVLAAALAGLSVPVHADDYCSETSGTWHCFSTYEVGPGEVLTYNIRCNPATDPLCPADGGIDLGGILYDGCLSADHANNGGDPARDYPYCGGLSDETVYIHDDFWGSGTGSNPIGAVYCDDRDNDSLCGDDSAGERFDIFCGHTLLEDIDAENAYALVYFVDGPLFQQFDCPASGAVTGATTGSFSIWVTPVSPLPPNPPGCIGWTERRQPLVPSGEASGTADGRTCTFTMRVSGACHPGARIIVTAMTTADSDPDGYSRASATCPGASAETSAVTPADGWRNDVSPPNKSAGEFVCTILVYDLPGGPPTTGGGSCLDP
jgi:hypothetical protein